MVASNALNARLSDPAMSRSVEVFQVDAFTRQRFAGNPAGVVLNADCLSDDEKQAIARELNNGDTAFVGAATSDDHDVSIRFFTPRTEAAFVGHATLAAHAVLNAREPKAVRRQRGKTGIVEVTALAGDAGFSIRQPPAPLGRLPDTAELDELLLLVGLHPEQLDPACPPQIAGSASTRLLLGLRDAADLAAVTPQLNALAALSPRMGAQGYFLFSRHGAPQGFDTEARMFCPALGIDEDPVSGNAHGMLGVYLQQRRLLEQRGAHAGFFGAQGRHVKRPGRVEVEVALDGNGVASSVTLTGQAVVVFQSRIEL
jgi:PhzF family phenazine biosynthesis protein